jgi:hypothetical protein
MNKARRKMIEDAMALVESAKSMLEEARDEEQEYFDNMPESLQSSEKGENAESAIACLDDVIGYLDSAMEEIGNII